MSGRRGIISILLVIVVALAFLTARCRKMVTRSARTSAVSGLYQALVQHRIHQDQLLWSRVQIIHAIQAAVLAGGFTLHFAQESSLLGGSLVVIGGLLTIGMFVLVVADYADMKVNVPIMDELARRLLPRNIPGEIKWTDETVLNRKSVFARGHYIIYASIIVVIVMDFVVGAFLLCRPSIFG